MYLIVWPIIIILSFQLVKLALKKYEEKFGE